MEGHSIFNILLAIKIVTLSANLIMLRRDASMVSNVKLAPNAKMIIVYVLWK